MFLYAQMVEHKALEMKPGSSLADPMSAADSDSMLSMTPKGEYGRARGFFRDQPMSTTHRDKNNHFDLSTPKGASKGIDLNDFKIGLNIPSTPKLGGQAIDMGAELA